MKVRIGLHTGEAELRDGDYYGASVNRCARLRGIGHGGQTVLSEATAALVRHALPAGVSMRDRGEHRLRDVASPERLFQAVRQDLLSRFLPRRASDARPHNLPVERGFLLGRACELAEAEHLLLREDFDLLALT